MPSPKLKTTQQHSQQGVIKLSGFSFHSSALKKYKGHCRLHIVILPVLLVYSWILFNQYSFFTRTPASARRRPAAKTPTRLPRRPRRPPRARARWRTSCGRCWTSSSARACGCATRPSCCAASSTSGIPPTRRRSRSRAPSQVSDRFPKRAVCWIDKTRLIWDELVKFVYNNIIIFLFVTHPTLS